MSVLICQLSSSCLGPNWRQDTFSFGSIKYTVMLQTIHVTSKTLCIKQRYRKSKQKMTLARPLTLLTCFMKLTVHVNSSPMLHFQINGLYSIKNISYTCCHPHNKITVWYLNKTWYWLSIPGQYWHDTTQEPTSRLWWSFTSGQGGQWSSISGFMCVTTRKAAHLSKD